MLNIFHTWQPPEQWNGGIGFISKEIIKSHCPEPAQDIQVELTTYYRKQINNRIHIFYSCIDHTLLGLSIVMLIIN